jgi:hypothetical protein
MRQCVSYHARSKKNFIYFLRMDVKVAHTSRCKQKNQYYLGITLRSLLKEMKNYIQSNMFIYTTSLQ